MAFFRKRLELPTAMRLVLGATIRRDYSAALAPLRSGGILTAEDLVSVEREMPIFELALWFLRFMDYASALRPQEIGEQFELSLAAAYRDSGVATEEAQRRIEPMMESILSYPRGLQSVDPEWLESRGIDFCCCQQFTQRVLPRLNLAEESARERHFQVFDLAKQALRTIESSFKGMLSEYRLV
jgi:hypothetical protein